jgi:hypothetical protein
MQDDGRIEFVEIGPSTKEYVNSLYWEGKRLEGGVWSEYNKIERQVQNVIKNNIDKIWVTGSEIKNKSS